jgi:tRNA-splicing ligase RtcB
MNITVVGDIDQRAIDQLKRCTEYGDAVAGAICADGHLGYSQPIGGVIAYKDHISPSGVGYDIGCGNKAVRTDLWVPTMHSTDIVKIMDEISSKISFGMGRNNDEPVDHPVLDKIKEASFIPQRKLSQLASNQLGTVGSGNHYVDLFEDETGYMWVGVHFGSRGFGHKTASGFLALAQGKEFGEHAPDGEMDSPPILFSTESDLGQSYIEAMKLAGEYAYAGRDVVVDKVLDILGAKSTESIHNHHNFAWKENHFGEEVWVVRKGCTPAFPGQKGFVGATMGEPSVILEGKGNDDEFFRGSTDLMYSTVHGAGRVMSRTQAAGKTRRRKYYECNNRDCSYNHTDSNQGCPKHQGKMIKRWSSEQIRPGLIDFDKVKNDLDTNNIVLRGGAADEAPEAYKRLDTVLNFHKDTINIVHTLKPLGVAMAGKDIYDPFKD